MARPKRNRLVQNRLRSLSGPFMQPIGKDRLIHTPGNLLSSGVITHHGVPVTFLGEALRMPELFQILGQATMQLENPPYSPSIDDLDWYPVTGFDHIELERGGFTADTDTGTITTPDPPPSQIDFVVGIDAEMSAAEQLDVTIFVNGVPSSFPHASIQGQGVGRPVSVSWVSTQGHPPEAQSTYQLRIRNGDVGNLTPTIRRMVFTVSANG